MIPQAKIIIKPDIDFDEMLLIINSILNHNPAHHVDNYNFNLSIPEKLSSILAAIKNPDAKPGLYENLLPHMSYSVMIIGLEDDVRDAVELCSMMPFILNETKRRGFALSILSGTLSQWESCVVAGLSKNNEMGVRSIFNSIYDSFVQEGIQLWNHFHRKTEDNILLLEKK